jgi:hypothetical protein
MFQQPVSLRRTRGAEWPAPAQYRGPAPPAPSPGSRTSASDLTPPPEFSSHSLSVSGPCGIRIRLPFPDSDLHFFPYPKEYKFLFCTYLCFLRLFQDKPIKILRIIVAFILNIYKTLTGTT